MPASIGWPNEDLAVRSGPYTALICDTLVRFRRLNVSTTRSSVPCGLMLKYLRIRISSVAVDGRCAAFLEKPSGRDVNGKAPLRLSSLPVTAFTGLPEAIVRIGAISM